MLKLMIFLIGFGLSLIGFTYVITYLNYLTIGYTWYEYLNLVLTRPECLISIIGLLLLGYSIFTRRDNNDIYLWFSIKF